MIGFLILGATIALVAISDLIESIHGGPPILDVQSCSPAPRSGAALALHLR